MRVQALVRLLVASFLMFTVQVCSAASIDWQPYSGAAFAKAKKEHRLVLVFGKATWCPWCRRMKNETFTDSTVVSLINKNYVPVMIDIDNESEIATRYSMSVVPAIIILDGDYKVIESKNGYQDASSFTSFLRSINS